MSLGQSCGSGGPCFPSRQPVAWKRAARAWLGTDCCSGSLHVQCVVVPGLMGFSILQKQCQISPGLSAGQPSGPPGHAGWLWGNMQGSGHLVVGCEGTGAAWQAGGCSPPGAAGPEAWGLWLQRCVARCPATRHLLSAAEQIAAAFSPVQPRPRSLARSLAQQEEPRGLG